MHTYSKKVTNSLAASNTIVARLLVHNHMELALTREFHCRCFWVHSWAAAKQHEPGVLNLENAEWMCVCLSWPLAALVLNYVPVCWTDEVIISGICVSDRKTLLPSPEPVAALRVSFSSLVLYLWGCSCGSCRGSVWGNSWDDVMKQRCWGRECRWSQQGKEWNTGRWVSKSQKTTSSILL